MTSVLIIGATRGLGAALVKEYASNPKTLTYATTRSDAAPSGFPDGIKWLSGIDLTNQHVGDNLSSQLEGEKPIDIVIINAGRFMTEDFSKSGGPNWDDELTMYTVSSIAPLFIVHRLVHNERLKAGSKIILISSEAGSITLRHEKEGGGNYAHHASKAALNMGGKLLSIDLKEKGIIVSIVHPGFMRTEMTKGVGFDKHWDEGGAVTPEVAAKSLVDWTETLDISKSGEYWAPRGPRDIGMAETVLGNNLETPLKLPW
ncbi:C-factor [Daldinia childiae]|uniref:C-factor n=1 Tax=Daldinia childiae TaxID=326645 RepID=UPI0014476180|nr:C-factor [Daldinia childiae]KAF3055140.1 C-factor [Daldinia childiae]